MAQNLNVEYRITPIQITIIKYLIDRTDKECYQKDLYHTTGRGKSTISSVLTTMEKNGLIIKDSNVDSKLTHISLTNKALNIYQIIKSNLDDFGNMITEGLSNDELNIFFEVIYTIKKNINKKGD